MADLTLYRVSVTYIQPDERQNIAAVFVMAEDREHDLERCNERDEEDFLLLCGWFDEWHEGEQWTIHHATSWAVVCAGPSDFETYERERRICPHNVIVFGDDGRDGYAAWCSQRNAECAQPSLFSDLSVAERK